MRLNGKKDHLFMTYHKSRIFSDNGTISGDYLKYKDKRQRAGNHMAHDGIGERQKVLST